MKEGAIGDKSTGAEAGPENSRKGACSAFTSSCAYAENNVVVFPRPPFFLPVSLPALPSCFNLFPHLRWVLFIFQGLPCSLFSCTFFPHFKSSRKNFLLLHTLACSSFLVSTLLVLALHGESVLVPAQVSLPHSYYPFCWDVEVAAWKEQNCNTCLLHLRVHTVLSLMWL